MVKLTAREMPVLRMLDEVSQPNGEFCVSFHHISGEPKDSAGTKEVRRIVRQLARKGLAEYHRGLFTDDGYFGGSGYCISARGRAALREHE